MNERVERLSASQIASRCYPGGLAAAVKFSACTLLAALLVASGSVFADHAPDHQASSAAPKSGFNPLKALQQLTGGSKNEFLAPDVAYVLSTEARGATTLIARFDIADDYYLYRDKFSFAVSGAPGVVLDSTQLPDGKEKEDSYFGLMEVYYDSVEAVLRLQRSTAGSVPLTLEVGYQGCAEAGLCYPPMKKSVTLTLPAVTARNSALTVSPGDLPASAEAMGELPEQDRIARYLASGSTLLILLSFFGFGLLLTFTPCVLPMIPILSSIIVGQGKSITTRRAFSLSLTYVLAMAATYTIAGVVAGLAGANLQAVFQEPWILGLFAGVFVALALSMFGLYDLQIPARLQTTFTRLTNRQQGGTYVGVGVMGLLSALIVGPCVAAPLAGALIYISQSGDALLGGTALFALSMGMGAPVLAAGTSGGKLLPRVGPWMARIKVVFGFMLLAVAIYLLERIIPEGASMFLWGALLVGIAVYLGALDSLQAPAAGGWRRLGKALGLVVGIYGVLIIVGAAGGGNDVFRPLEGSSFLSGDKAPARKLVFKQVKGLEGLNIELKLASVEGKAVMLDFYADWCVSCKELERYTFSDPGVQSALADVVLLQTDVTANDSEDQALLRELGLFGPPAILFFGPDGKELPQFRVVGFVNAEKFRAHAIKAVGTGRSPASIRESRITPKDSKKS
jgi:thiol:disulfide interchange protein DsbD